MFRPLTSEEITRLERQSCTAENWQQVLVKEGFDPTYVEDAHFSGDVRIGVFNRIVTMPGGVKVHSGIRHAVIHRCNIGDDCHIYNVHNYIANYDIGEDTCIENVNALLVDGTSRFGNGVRVAVMNEGGGREIPIFDHLSAHLAYILTLYRHRPHLIEQVETMIDEYAARQESDMGHIGKHVRIINCGSIKNVRIGDYTQVAGTSRLRNGSINSNEAAPVRLGSGVKCTDFIISSGVEISDSTLVDKCFVGQGCIFDKHYSAGESLFFSNCQGMHGEATAVFAGPYTVTHHKSTLLIAGMFSFLNAGSGSNQSNHMYKLGPIHQGLVERGSKTTSDSYLLWPARVGAFSLVMGRHTHHTDTASLPFSYLIENNSESYLVPGANLRTVGTIRDAQKWPKRDNRKDPVRIDQINFNLLSPYTIQKMLQGKEILTELQQISGENTEVYGYRNCKIRNGSLRHGIRYYDLGIAKFLGNSLISRIEKKIAPDTKHLTIDRVREMLVPDTEIGKGEWIDLSGLIAPKSEITRLMNEIEEGRLSLSDVQQRFVSLHENYYTYEWTWALDVLETIWKCKVSKVTMEQIVKTINHWQDAVVELDNMIYDDAKKEFDLNSQTGFGADGNDEQRKKDFESVRGRFESNPFVTEVKAHIARKSALGDKMRNLLS
ncbi:MAG: DUF4954 family protein [Paludibacteraceae bacterium]|nr:DUF4954 family protein [Paludibacteraceae bacterium]